MNGLLLPGFVLVLCAYFILHLPVSQIAYEVVFYEQVTLHR